MALTKVSGGILDPGINVAGIVTATGFDGPFTGGSSKNITAGIITATGFDLNGNGDISGNLVIGGNLTANGDFTTLNTTLREVEILRVDANTTAVAGIITQRGSGDIFSAYDTSTEVFKIADGGNVSIIKDLDVDGQTDLDDVVIAGVTTFSVGPVAANGQFYRGIINSGSQQKIVGGYINGSDTLRLGESMYLTSTGLGIGVASPTQKLDVNGSVKATGADINGNADISGNLDVDGLASFDDIVVSAASTFTGLVDINGGATVNGGLTSTLLTINGGANPATINHSGGNALTLARGGKEISFNANYAASNTYAVMSVTSGMDLRFTVGGRDGVTIDGSNGYMGIDTNAPTAPLHIASNAAALKITRGGKNFTFNANYGSGNSYMLAQLTSGMDLKFNLGGSDRIVFKSAGHIEPETAGAMNIGSASKEIGHVYVADSKTIYVGSDQDLRIAHDPTHTVSYIQNTGPLQIQSDDLKLYNYSTADLYLRAQTNSSVDLYYDFSTHATPKLKTSATGIEVHGEVAASQDYPNFRPTVDFNFAAEKKLDPRINYVRTGTASYLNEFGKIVTVGENEPRFDHDPTTLESKGLLIEESRQNMFGATADMGSNAGRWPVGGARGRRGVNVEGPDGKMTALQNIYLGTSGDLNIYYETTTGATEMSTTNSTVYTFSVFAKAAAGNSYINGIRLRAHSPNRSVSFNVVNGTVGATNEGSSSISSKTIVKYPNGWYRCIMTFTSGTDGNHGFQIYVENEGGDNAALNNSSANGEAMYFWGAQLEIGSFATSFIPTQSRDGRNRGSQTIRGYEAVTLDGSDFKDVFGTEFKEFSLVADYDNTQTPDGTNYGIIDLWGESTGYNDRIEWFKDDASPYHIETRAFGGGNALFNNGEISASSKAKSQRFATSWYVPDYSNTSSRRFVVSMGGEAVDIIPDNTGTTVPQLTRMGIGCNPTRLDFKPGLLHFKRLMVYNKTLSDGQLQNLSAQ